MGDSDDDDDCVNDDAENDDVDAQRAWVREQVENELKAYWRDERPDEQGLLLYCVDGEWLTDAQVDSNSSVATDVSEVGVLDCWHRIAVDFLFLELAARVALVVSASEIASERMFSRAGRILRGDRCRMRPATLEKLVLHALTG